MERSRAQAADWDRQAIMVQNMMLLMQ